MGIAIALAPALISAAMQIYQAYASDPSTPAEERAAAELAIKHLEAAVKVVAESPLPDEGSGV